MLIVNFGGPRSLKEVEPFLIALLTDRDVIRSRFPSFFHRWFFTRVAKKRSFKVAEDYQLIGGRSPIFEDTQAVADAVSVILDTEILTFHRYLPATHAHFLEQTLNLKQEVIPVFPMFPQFSYATTGSIARFFAHHLPAQIVCKMRWIKSYADHPAFVHLIQQNIRDFFQQNHLKEEDTMLLFSAHGLPRAFVETGDSYEHECRQSFQAIKEAFPEALSLLAYQSKFGRGEWLRPYTEDVCNKILSFSQGRPYVVFIPLSFTSDHIETLFEIEYLYLPLVRRQGLNAFRCPAPNRNPAWISAIATIVQTAPSVANEKLIY